MGLQFPQVGYVSSLVEVELCKSLLVSNLVIPLFFDREFLSGV